MLYTCEREGVTFLRSDRISTAHAFSTRKGGLSRLPHTREMNLALGKGDDDETVYKNYSLLEAAAGIVGERAFCTQVHSSRVVYAKNGGDMGECDGLYTDKKGIILTVKTADCLPVLLEDREAGVVGAVHAGWRGSAAGIISECIRGMESIGAKRERTVIAIGPHIHKCCFEVKDDFVRAVTKMTHLPSQCFTEKRADKLYADISAINRALLSALGIPSSNIDCCELCTACDTDTFFSHRIMGAERGIMCAEIVL